LSVPVADVDEPSRHDEHGLPPPVENLPDVQFLQPADVASCPAGHVVTDDDPARHEKPAAHATHVEFDVALSTEDAVPAGQSVQFASDHASVAALHVPAGHGDGDGAPSGQKKPLGHALAVDEFEPAGQKKPAVHGPVQFALVRAVTLPKRPAGHGAVQLADGSPAVAP